MKKINLLAGLLLFSLCGYSQTMNVGLRGGLSVPNIVAGGDNPLSTGYTSHVAGEGGIFAEMELNNHVAFRLGVEYSGQGGRRNGMQGMPSEPMMEQMKPLTEQMITNLTNAVTSGEISRETAASLGGLMSNMPNIFYADVKNTAEFDYLMIPISVQIGTDASKRWRVYANAGPFVSFLLHGKQITKGSSNIYMDKGKSKTVWSNIPAEMMSLIEMIAPEKLQAIIQNGTDFTGTQDITQDLNPVNAGIQGDIGLAYRCNRHKIFVEVGGNYGFIKMQKNTDNGSNRIGAATVMLGYAFRMGQI
ncbi:MAG: outer membrane beta-barrel protein [Dysgonamonadaceae bacterium]|jgi:hypothetical protein|nr:outer membrane beta-barrel protein [Dysgonamonadaceae bacterium]